MAKHPPRRLASREAGFTLIEVLVCTLILTTGMLAIAGLLAVTDAARHFAACQLAEIEAAAQSLCAREDIGADAPVIGAGCGRFIAKKIAERLGRPYRDFADLIACDPRLGEAVAACAPAVAVGLLAESEVLLPSARRVIQ